MTRHAMHRTVMAQLFMEKEDDAARERKQRTERSSVASLSSSVSSPAATSPRSNLLGWDSDYHGGPPSQAAYDLIPSCRCQVVVWSFSCYGWTGRAVGFANGNAMAICLQRRIFLTLAACASAFTYAVEEHLGRPLSEDPEFWCVAPEAARQWSAEEFPTRRSGEELLRRKEFSPALPTACEGVTTLQDRWQVNLQRPRFRGTWFPP